MIGDGWPRLRRRGGLDLANRTTKSRTRGGSDEISGEGEAETTREESEETGSFQVLGGEEK